MTGIHHRRRGPSRRHVDAHRRAAADPALAGWWALPPDTLFARLHTHADGLSSRAAAMRLRRFGANAPEGDQRLSTALILLRQFRSPIVLALLAAATVAAALGEWTDAAIILAIVLGSAALGFVQEHRATRALETLRGRVRVTTSVVRDVRTLTLPSDQVVPGDVVLLAAGSLVPADGVILDAKDCFVIESALTGESHPVEKQPGVASRDAALGARTNCLFMGTSLRSGTARLLVVHTGISTVFGGIAGRLRLRPPETAFERGLRQYGYLLARIMLLLVPAVVAANVLLDRPPVESLLFAIALAVGMSPELLPAIVTITLAQGARAMATGGVIVRRLEAIENFGAMDILCTDKTGTLTVGVMALEGALDANGLASLRVLRDACTNARLQAGLPNPLDDAIGERAHRDGVTPAGERVDEVPYDFARRRLSIVVTVPDCPDRHRMITKGAYASVLDVCTHVREGDATQPLDVDRRAALGARFAAWSAEGRRVLGIATKEVRAQASWTRDDERDLVFEGFLCFTDPPKEGIRETLAALVNLGVRVKILTGDNRLVAAHLAASVGLGSRPVITGTELDAVHDEALWRIAEDSDVFAELDPHQKERIITALARAGHAVGFLGDGINDVPALHAADVGISVDGAVDVARDAADLVLMERDLGVLCQGIVRGRTTFANTLKYVSITTSANFGNMVSMALASLFLPFLPLAAKQILLNNFLSDIPAMAIAGDAVDPEQVATPRRWDLAEIRRFMITYGLVSTVFDLLTFAILLHLFQAGTGLFRTAWFVESVLTELAIVLVVRTRRPLWRSRPGTPLVVATALIAALTLALPYLPIAASFDLVPLPASLVATLLVITAAYVMASEVTKQVVQRRARSMPPRAA